MIKTPVTRGSSRVLELLPDTPTRDMSNTELAILLVRLSAAELVVDRIQRRVAELREKQWINT